MATSGTASHSTTVKDVKQLGIWAALASLSYVFWICGAMEMVERLAFYGVRQVSSLSASDPTSRPYQILCNIFLVAASYTTSSSL